MRPGRSFFFLHLELPIPMKTKILQEQLCIFENHMLASIEKLNLFLKIFYA